MKKVKSYFMNKPDGRYGIRVNYTAETRHAAGGSYENQTDVELIVSDPVGAIVHQSFGVYSDVHDAHIAGQDVVNGLTTGY